MDDSFDLSRTVYRELARSVLELAQGEMFRRPLDDLIGEGSAPEGVVEELDIAYMNRDGVPLAMDIMYPDVSDDVELPVIVAIHGGGLVFGDRRVSRAYSRVLAKAGYLTFSIEYRLAPRANVCEQLDDVCAGMDLVGKRLVSYNVDFTRMFLTAESAGAYLAVYVAAMKDSICLQKAIGYEPTNMRFRALGLISGMFYTQRNDLIGMLLSDQFYGNKRADEAFLRYMDPEHPEIVRNLPPAFFITSQGDFLNSYTIDYHKALARAGKQTHLLYYGGKDLGHAFVTIVPELEQSQDAITKMLSWFEGQADKARAALIPTPEGKARIAKIDERVASGEIARQKAWEFVRELNSVNEVRLDAIALRDSKRCYSYRQLFQEQESYAKAFSGLGITQANGSRVGVAAGISVVPVFAFYALNMLGVSVSMLDPWDALSSIALRNMVKAEGITDLLLLDTGIDEVLLREIVRHSEEMGLRHIIVACSSEGIAYANPHEQGVARRRWKALKRVKRVFFLPELLSAHEATPISYGNGQSDEAAIIVHSSGTTKGTHKSIPLSDETLNATARRFFLDERLAPLRSCTTSLLNLPLFSATGMVDMLHVPLALGFAVAITHDARDMMAPIPEQAAVIEREGVDMMLINPSAVDMLSALPDTSRFDFSGLKVLIFGGGPLSRGQLRRAKEFFEDCGGSPTFVNGYGLTESAAAVIVNICDSAEGDDDEAGSVPIGYPLPGADVLLRDVESGAWRNPSEGPCIGELYIHSESNSSGQLDGTTLFEHEIVDGVPYLCTNDLVSVDEAGCMTYVGRANRYFVSYGDEKFDAGIVEEAIRVQNDIDSCAIVPCFERVTLHDTVPVLYIKVAHDASQNHKGIVRRALTEAYRNEERLKRSPLPWMCVIADDLPLNANGKVDIVRIMTEDVSGREYMVEAQRDDDGELSQVSLKPVRAEQVDMALSVAGISDEVREERYEIVRNLVRMYGLARVPLPLLGYAFEMGRNWMDDARAKRRAGTMFGTGAMLQRPPMAQVPPFMQPGIPFMPGRMPPMAPAPKPAKKGGRGKHPPMLPFVPVMPMPMMPPPPFMPGVGQQGKGEGDIMAEVDGEGMMLPEPINSLMRFFFQASPVAHDYEE